MTVILDQEQRQQAISPHGSFIVQAPAGSGKTALLVQRILVLLAQVDEPEEVLAITFTRKAASEMRERIIMALRDANENPEPEEDYQRVTWQLARGVLEHDRQCDWGLLVNPSRLRIQTIDALCATLVYQMPLLSRFGAIPDVVEDAAMLYKEAALRTIDELESGETWSESIGYLVAHLDNRLDYLQSLICNMLAKRDQWLRHVVDPDHPAIGRENLESALSHLIESLLADLGSVWPSELDSSLISLSSFALKQMPEGSVSVLDKCINQGEGLPEFTIAHLDAWKEIADFLLTQEGNVRKSVNKNQGFPAKSAATDASEQVLFSEMKDLMGGLLKKFSEQAIVCERLHQIRQLPDSRYDEEEWQTLQALFELLRVAAAQLELVFVETASVDFTAMSRAAIHALGDADCPTDLALALDYQIKHILVDEFQDTSLSQFELVKRLIAGWHQDDHRTLFLVGDPMQSIYRFREAEVGLFIEAWEYGIGDIDLQTIQLQVNFRSQAGIIKWVNKSFKGIMPEENDMQSGAVSYVDSVAYHAEHPEQACHIYPYIEKQEVAEAEQIRDIIATIRQKDAAASIAILVRGRTHLFEIVNTLRAAAIKFRAVELEALSERPVIQDLQALLLALTNPADNIAWLGILRAPWCGLSLEDLYTLRSTIETVTLFECISDQRYLQDVSDDGVNRLQRFVHAMEPALFNIQRKNCRDWVEGVWCQLGGPACLQSETDLQDAAVFFQLLEKMDEVSLSERPSVIQQSIRRLFALADVTADDSLQIMTIHKSKGLEFDAVILPGLGYKPSNNDSDLMKWSERPSRSGENDLLLAPIKQTGADINKKYRLLADFEKQKESYENERLLYVAVTRARQQLHLMGHVKYAIEKNEAVLKSPLSGSLLSALWPAVQPEFAKALKTSHMLAGESSSANESEEPPVSNRNTIKRLPGGWDLPKPAMSSQVDSVMVEMPDEVLEFDWAGETARIIGTVVHELLQEIGDAAQGALIEPDPGYYKQRSQYLLKHYGLNNTELETSLPKVLLSLENCIADSRGQWVLNPGHTEIQSEYALSGCFSDTVKHIVIDRTFVDGSGIRWIIDYKTGGHSGTGKDEFLDRELLRYRAQLDTYARIVAQMDARPIKLGLYFPLLQGWREWEFDRDAL